MDDKELDRMIDEAAHIPLPEGLAGRLERQIDLLAAAGKKQRRKRFIIWASGAAAAIFIGAGIFFADNLPSPPLPQMADTYTDPAEAAHAAGKALAFMSNQLNKGLDQVSDAEQKMETVNNIVYKHLGK